MQWLKQKNRRTYTGIVWLFCITCLGLSCKNPLRKLEKETILKRMAELRSFSGKYIETGVAEVPLETEIRAQTNPVAVLARTVSKGRFEGAVLQYANGTLQMYFPKSGFGIRYRNVPELQAADQLLWLEREYDWHIDHYEIAQLSDGNIAGHETKGISYAPNAAFSAGPFHYTWNVQVEPTFAFALKTSMQSGSAETYSLEFKQIEFQKTFSKSDLEFRFPGGATVAEYDLASRNYTLQQARASANFKIKLPKDAADFPLKKIVRVQGLIPAFTFFYESSPYQTYYTQVRDYGLNLVPARGVTIMAKRKYRVNFAGALKSIFFLENGVYHTVVSSRPLSEVLQWLDAN
jgi:hypothetical protein